MIILPAIPSYLIIIVTAVSLVAVCYAIYLYYCRFIPVHWLFFVAAAFQLLVICYFQYKIESLIGSGNIMKELIPLSRLLRLYTGISTGAISISVIIYHYVAKGRKGCNG